MVQFSTITSGVTGLFALSTILNIGSVTADRSSNEPLAAIVAAIASSFAMTMGLFATQRQKNMLQIILAVEFSGFALAYSNKYIDYPEWFFETQKQSREILFPLGQGIASYLMCRLIAPQLPRQVSDLVYFIGPVLTNLGIEWAKTFNPQTRSFSFKNPWDNPATTVLSPYLGLVADAYTSHQLKHQAALPV